MTAQNRTALKALFETGDTITQSSMSTLIDSFLDIAEVSSQTIAGPIIFSSNASFNAAVSASALSLTSPLPVNSGGTGQFSYTDGQILIGNSSGNTLNKSTLTAGTNITVTNAGGSITIACPAATGGNLILLQTQSASSSASIIFNSTYITSTYKKYIIDIIDAVPATDNAVLTAVVSEDNGSTYKTSAGDYSMGLSNISSNGSLTGLSDNSQARLNLCLTTGAGGVGNASGESGDATLIMFDPTGTGLTKNFIISSAFVNASGFADHIEGVLAYKATTNAINNIKILFSSGNIASGTFKLYGVL